jgi:hypothetical protein
VSPEPAAAEAVRRPPADEPEPSQAHESAPPPETAEAQELRCTICGLRACWTG